MAILKNNLKENFSIVPNEVITSNEPNDGEYRLLMYLYHLPNDWEVNQEYLANKLGLSRVQINRRISNLKTKKFIEIIKIKIGQNKWKYDYILNIPNVSEMQHQQMLQQQMLQPTNTNYNKELNITNIKKENIKRKKYGFYGRVLLTDEEHKKLNEEFTEDYIIKIIKYLDEYIQSNNNKNKYKDFNLVIRKAIRENWFKNQIIQDLAKEQEGQDTEEMFDYNWLEENKESEK